MAVCSHDAQRFGFQACRELVIGLHNTYDTRNVNIPGEIVSVPGQLHTFLPHDKMIKRLTCAFKRLLERRISKRVLGSKNCFFFFSHLTY